MQFVKDVMLLKTGQEGCLSSGVDSGHRVVFDQDEETGTDLSVIIHKRTGKCIRMRRDRNVWVIDTYVEGDEALPTDAGFARPE